MPRHEICAASALEPGERTIKTVDEREIAVFNIDGEFEAVANYCVHAGGPVCEGTLSGMVSAEPGEWEWEWCKEGEILACPWHGWEFDIETGDFVADDRYSLITYNVEVEDGTVYVVTGEPSE